MAEDQAGPDLWQGLSLAELPDGGKLVGHVGDEQVLLTRQGSDAFAVGAHCTHYHGPLVDGLIVDGAVRCPWHHACFDLRTGEAVRAPAFSPLDTWTVEQRDGKLFVREKRARPSAKPRAASGGPNRIVIVGGGAAGFAAAEMLRRQQYGGEIVVLSSDDAPPVDRPSLSKDYLAGSAPEEWVPLSPPSFYSDNSIDLRLRSAVRRSCGAVGRTRGRGKHRRQGLSRPLQARRTHARCRFDLPRPAKPGSRGAHGTRRGAVRDFV